jgi:helicase
MRELEQKTRLLALKQALPETNDTYTPLFKNGTKEKAWPHHAALKLGADLVPLYQGSLPDATAYLR